MINYSCMIFFLLKITKRKINLIFLVDKNKMKCKIIPKPIIKDKNSIEKNSSLFQRDNIILHYYAKFEELSLSPFVD